MSDNSTSTGGTSILGLLGVLFIGLKLTGHITWSWWWVLAPFWFWFAILSLIIVVLFLWEFTKQFFE